MCFHPCQVCPLSSRDFSIKLFDSTASIIAACLHQCLLLPSCVSAIITITIITPGITTTTTTIIIVCFQSLGKVVVDVEALGVDLLTIVGHKFGEMGKYEQSTPSLHPPCTLNTLCSPLVAPLGNISSASTLLAWLALLVCVVCAFGLLLI